MHNTLSEFETFENSIIRRQKTIYTDTTRKLVEKMHAHLQIQLGQSAAS